MKKHLNSREIFINEIQFHRKDVIYLFGFFCSDGKFVRSRFVCNRKMLYALLVQNGKTGREIIALIRTLLERPHASPLCIDLIDHFGTTLPLQAYSIQMQIPFPETSFEKANSERGNEVLFIERIIPFPAA